MAQDETKQAADNVAMSRLGWAGLAGLGWAELGCWAGLGSLTGVKVVAVCVPAARTSTNGHGLPARPRIHDIFLLGGGTRPGAGGTGAGGGGQLLGRGQGAARGRRRPRCAWCGVPAPAPDRAVSAFHCGRSRSRVYSTTAHRTITLRNILQNGHHLRICIARVCFIIDGNHIHRENIKKYWGVI